MERMEIRLDPATEQRLRALSTKLELRRPDIIRLALREACERRGMLIPDPHAHPDPQDAPPAREDGVWAFVPGTESGALDVHHS